MPRLMPIALLALALAMPPSLAAAQSRYTVKTMGDIVQLRDNKTDTVVSVLTPVNNAYEMVVNGHNTIRMSIKSVDELRARPGLNGVPFLAPFANRLDQDAFFANGKKYNFDMQLGNVRGAIPIHGYLTGTDHWKVIEVKADDTGCWITSELDFYKYPDYMKQFPFAHTITMTYKLADGSLEVHTRLDNLAAEPMPVAIGFHPYFALTDSVRNDWTLDVPAKTHWLLDKTKIPTGLTEPAENFFGGDPHKVPLSRFAQKDIDDVFTDLERDNQGRATVSLHGAKQTISVTLGPNFRALLVYSTVPEPVSGNRRPLPPTTPVSVGPDVPLSATETGPTPPDRGFVAFEPYAGITDSMNLAYRGLYKDLQSIPPGGHWEGSFWIKPSGY
jgi:aldose 1-epimerase